MKIVRTNIIDSKTAGSLTKEAILSNCARRKIPLVFIASGNIRIKNSNLYIDDLNPISLLGLSTYRAVSIMRNNGVDAYIASHDIGMFPAMMLLDFSSDELVVSDVTSSPFNISKIHGKNTLNMPSVDDLNISRNIVSIYNNDITYLLDGDEEYSYAVDVNNIFISNLRSGTKALIECSVSNYFLYADLETVVDISKHTTDRTQSFTELSTFEREVLGSIDSTNKGIL